LPDLSLGVLAAPGLPAKLAPGLAAELREDLDRRYPDVHWRVTVVSDGLLAPPAATTDLLEAARQRLLEREWDLAVCLTDLPLRLGRRPVIGHASPMHSVALLSVPALGPIGLRRRARNALFTLVEELLGRNDHDERGRQRAQRLDQLADLGDQQVSDGAAALLMAPLTGGNLRLLLGMVRANHPWRLAIHLYRLLVAALAAAVFGLVTRDIWSLAAGLGPVRLTALTLISVGATTVSLIATHDLWESARHRRARAQVALFNLVTAVTVIIGVLALYAALFVFSLVSAALLITPDLLGSAIGERVGGGAYVQLAWLVSSLATVGGALGAGLETQDHVRQAAYANRPDTTPASAAPAAQGRDGDGKADGDDPDG
jgi:uncharacterized membrane protein